MWCIKCMACNRRFIIMKLVGRMLPAPRGKMHVHDVGFSGESLPVVVSTLTVHRAKEKPRNWAAHHFGAVIAIVPHAHAFTILLFRVLFALPLSPTQNRSFCQCFDFDERGYIWPASQIQFKTKEKISVRTQKHRTNTRHNCTPFQSTNRKQTKLVGGYYSSLIFVFHHCHCVNNVPYVLVHCSTLGFWDWMHYCFVVSCKHSPDIRASTINRKFVEIDKLRREELVVPSNILSIIGDYRWPGQNVRGFFTASNATVGRAYWFTRESNNTKINDCSARARPQNELAVRYVSTDIGILMSNLCEPTGYVL